MNKFNQLSHTGSASREQLPSRKFPKKQYQKLNHCLWFGLIIIIILISSVSFYGGIYYSNQHSKETNQTYKQNKQNQHYHQINHQSINHKLIQPNKIKSHHKKNNKLSLKDWLVRLRYSNAESNNILTIYKNAQSFRKRQINRQLNNINQQPITKQAKAKQVIRLLQQYQMINQNKLTP